MQLVALSYLQGLIQSVVQDDACYTKFLDENNVILHLWPSRCLDLSPAEYVLDIYANHQISPLYFNISAHHHFRSLMNKNSI